MGNNMKFNGLTLFTEMYEPLKYRIMERASKKNLIDINLINIRDFSQDKHKKVDDTPYRGRCRNGYEARCNI